MSDYGTTPPPPPPPPVGGAPGPVEHPKGTLILVLGILSLICFQPLGIAAWLMGNTALKEIDAQPGVYSNRQTVNIGRILGIVAVALMVISLVIFLILLAFGGLAALSAS